MADRLQMMQLLQNLVGNALKFRRPDVVPQIRIYHQLPADDVGKSSRMWHLYVADNGIGFDEKYVDRIFVPFQRLHGSNTYEGTGIGLAICRKIVERHGGTLTARSVSGQGTTFIVSLPFQCLPQVAAILEETEG